MIDVSVSEVRAECESVLPELRASGFLFEASLSRDATTYCVATFSATRTAIEITFDKREAVVDFEVVEVLRLDSGGEVRVVRNRSVPLLALLVKKFGYRSGLPRSSDNSLAGFRAVLQPSLYAFQRIVNKYPALLSDDPQLIL